MGKNNYLPPSFLKMSQKERRRFLETLEPETNTRQGKLKPNDLMSVI